jgi:hypothetical protein
VFFFFCLMYAVQREDTFFFWFSFFVTVFLSCLRSSNPHFSFLFCFLSSHSRGVAKLLGARARVGGAGMGEGRSAHGGSRRTCARQVSSLRVGGYEIEGYVSTTGEEVSIEHGM